MNTTVTASELQKLISAGSVCVAAGGLVLLAGVRLVSTPGVLEHAQKTKGMASSKIIRVQLARFILPPPS